MARNTKHTGGLRSALLALSAAVALVIGATVVTFWLMPIGSSHEGAGTGTATVGGPFSLTDHRGQAVTEADYAGKHLLIYFGFTYCPDVCPTRLLAMTQALEKLSPAKVTQVQPMLISVDPERDTPAVLADYVSHFSPDLVGLTGTPEQIAAVAGAYYVTYYKTHPEGVSDYIMDHTDIVYLMGPDGRYKAHFSHGSTPDDIAATLNDLL